MKGESEHHWLKVAVGYGLLLAATLIVAGVIFHAAEPAHKPMIVRLAAGFLVGVVLIHLGGRRRQNLLPDGPSDFERALARRPPTATLDPAFIRWRDEIGLSLRDNFYFHQVTWPNLQKLAHSLGMREEDIGQPIPSGRRFRRGPPLEELARLIERMERPS